MVWLVPFWIALAYLAPFTTIWIGLAYFTLVNACVARESKGGWTDSAGLGVVGWLGALGLYSYSLYLVNDPVHNVLLAASRRFGDATSVTPFMIRALLFTDRQCPGRARVIPGGRTAIPYPALIPP